MEEKNAVFVFINKLIIILIFAVCLIPLCFSPEKALSENIGQQSVSFNGTVYADGNITSFSSNDYTFDSKQYKQIILNGSFSEEISGDKALMVLLSDCTLRIAKGENTLYSSAIRQNSGGSEGFERIWMFADVGEIADSDNVILELNATNGTFSGEAANEFCSSLAVCNNSSVYSRLFSDLIFPVIVDTVLIVLAAVVLIFAFLTKDAGFARRVFVIFIMVILCGWRGVFDFRFQYLSLLFSRIRVINLLRLFPLFMMPLLLCIYLTFSVRGKTGKIISAIFSLLSLFSFSTMLIFVFAGIGDLHSTMLLLILPLISIAVNLVVLLIDGLHYGGICRNFLCILPLWLGVTANSLCAVFDITTHIFGISAGFILMAILSFISVYKEFLPGIKMLFNAKETEDKLEQNRVAIMLSQIRPHFLFNSFTAIKRLCATDPSKAEEAIDHFSGFLRRNLDSINRTKLIPFLTELDFINNYLYLERLRAGERLKIEYDIETDDFMLPALTVQPIVENAVRYGVTKKPEGGTVTITTRELDTAHLVIVSDDGVGFDPDIPKEDGKSHVGINNVRSRLDFQCGGTINIDSKPDKGTVVTVMIPKKRKDG